MTLGRASSGAIKIKTDGGTTRAVECGCCVSCPPLVCGAVKITDQNLINLLNSATSGSYNYSHGTDSLPLWVPTGADSFQANWNCCFNNPDGCDNCYFHWEYGCVMSWLGSQRTDCYKNVLWLEMFDLPWTYLATPENGQCSFCTPQQESYITINGYPIKMGMRYGCGTGFPIYPNSIILT